MLKLSNLKSLTTFDLFTEDECERIINSIDQDKIKYHTFVDMENYIVDAHKVEVDELNPDIIKLIKDKVSILSDNKIITWFILKYSEDTLPSMQPHYDLSSETLVIPLNNDFEGGETNFPFRFFKFKPQKYKVGTALFFKGDTFLSWHEALPVKKGVKYGLNVKYEDNAERSILKSISTVLKVIPVYFIFKKLYNYKRK
jgi:hypothetical protein